MRTELLIGPPGTGKTTSLLDEVDKAMHSGIPPERIAYCSFTRKAAAEAIDRATARFGVDKKRFQYFRTLHSVAFRELGLSRDEVMQTKHYKQLGEALGLDFAHIYGEDMERIPLGGSLGDKCMNVYALSKARRVSLYDQWRCFDADDLPFYLVQDFANALDHYKRSKYLFDFTDFMENCHNTLELDLFILDEAQDLTRQQWEFAKRLAKASKRVLIAGDDDQAIFQWAGADLDTLLRIKGERRVLPQSYRLPETIFALAQQIAGKITRRFPKEWKPRPEAGEINWQADLEQMDVSEGSWLLLARHLYQLPRLEQLARQQGVIYSMEGRWSNQEPYVRAIIAYEKIRKGGALKLPEAQLVSEYVLNMAPPTVDREYHYGDLRWPHSGQPDWMDALTRLAVEDREYIRSVLRRGGSLTNTGSVVISTIHGAKGGEADNVLLLTDVTKRVVDSIEFDPDAEARVWYVAVSRAKKRLFPVLSYDNKTWLNQ